MQVTDPVVVLTKARTSCEMRAVREWTAANYPDATISRSAEIDFDGMAPETLLVPVRAVWLPAVRQGERRVTLGDVLVLSGRWEMNGPGEGGARKKFEGNWINVMERRPDGWRTVLHTWN